MWPKTQVFGSNKFKRIVGSGIGPKQKMGLKIFSESVSPFLGRHSLNKEFDPLLAWDQIP